jgi:LuxR family transcriptional regulator, maltose regulon positive regulatory protein
MNVGALDCGSSLLDAASVTVSVRNGAISIGKGTPMGAEITTHTARKSAAVAPTTRNGPRAARERQTLDAAQPDERAPTSLLISARQALERGAWEAARGGFEAALSIEESPEALEGMGAAAWWLDDAPTVFASRERAYRLFRERGDDRSGGRLATELAYDYAVFRAELAVTNGWLQRAHRLLDDLDPGPEQIWLTLREGELAYHNDGDMERVRGLAVQAQKLAACLGLLDLELLGLALDGLALVGQGEVSAGMGRLDEATAAAVAGEMRDFHAIAVTLCFMVWACERVRDVDRASQWCDHFMAFCRRNGLRAHLAFCRAHYASVLTARGRWDEAEDQLAQALAGLQSRLAWTLSPLERLGELRRRQGRLEAAAECFERTHLYPPCILGQARVALDRDDPELALDLVQRVLRRLPERDRVQRIPSLELLVRIHCARGAVADAHEALQELEAVASIVRTDCLLALVSYGRGQVALTAGDATLAKAHLEDALDLYEGNRLPFEAALVRLDLGRALLALGRRDSALEQVRTADEAFRDLGAAAASARSRALADAFAGTAGPQILSPREAEVLHLLIRGLSNKEIAAELALSTHTVRRHVSNILTKLDLSSRTAVVAYSLQHQLV